MSLGHTGNLSHDRTNRKGQGTDSEEYPACHAPHDDKDGPCRGPRPDNSPSPTHRTLVGACHFATPLRRDGRVAFVGG